MGGPFKLKMLNFNSLIDALISNTDKQIGITFIESEENEEFLSYPELSKKAKLILSQLRAYGLKPGDELVFQFQSNKNFIITFWACLLGKIIPVPLTFTASGELKFINVWRVLQNP